MVYDEGLAERIRDVLSDERGVSEKKMFGGVAFLREGLMFCGIVKDELMVRVGPDRHEEALREPHARTMDFTGKPMKGYVFVASEGFESDATLKRWVTWGADFVASMPAKIAKRPAPASAPKKRAPTKPAPSKSATKKRAAKR